MEHDNDGASEGEKCDTQDCFFIFIGRGGGVGVQICIRSVVPYQYASVDWGVQILRCYFLGVTLYIYIYIYIFIYI